MNSSIFRTRIICDLTNLRAIGNTKKHLENNNPNNITYFSQNSIKGIEFPSLFTFPFYYQPHPLSQIAAAELQNYLENQLDLDHNFGLVNDQPGTVIGKMFGVLVVQDKEGRLGYLSAFSGKMAGSNDHQKFVPPVFDMLIEDSFFLKEQQVINSINQQVKEIESGDDYKNLKQDLERSNAQFIQEITDFKTQLKLNKTARKTLRDKQQSILNPDAYRDFEADLIKQSLRDKHLLSVLSNKWGQVLSNIKSAMQKSEADVEMLKNERKERSAALQRQLFEQYEFLNKNGDRKSLQAIFNDTVFGKPPSAAGECATPKLLQYAFLHGFKPLAMAEFWWGASPKSEIRKHKQFYPACTGKCKPILKHMLKGIALEDDPLLKNPGEGREIAIVYEDDAFVIVNKPAELLSVPGINISDSVYTRLKALWANVEPLIVHRLDMATSGLLVVAKTKDAHKAIQRQFLKRTVIKRYTALLSKVLPLSEGEISLPLRGDLHNRPRQLVCFEFGKKSVTKFKVVSTDATSTKVHFWPLTGRTHQLRVHSAHDEGLNAPIIGDDLYGTIADRLYLHASFLEFTHPITKAKLSFEVAEDF